MYRVIQNRFNLFLSMRGMLLLNILNIRLKFNNDFKYFIQVGRELKRGVDGVFSSLRSQIYLNFKLQMIALNIPFISQNYI